MSAIRSMTGYGRGKAKRGQAHVNVELRSVNGRYLDINLRLPTALAHLEPRLREIVREKVARGRIECNLSLDRGSAPARTASVDRALAKQVADALRELADAAGLDDQVSLELVARQPGVITVSERTEASAAEQSVAETAMRKALRDHDLSRRTEGAVLAQDLAGRAKDIISLIGQIEAGLPQARQELGKKLEGRLKSLASRMELDENRFQMEAAYLASRADITEEMTRLRSHLEQIRKTLNRGGICGRSLDFLIQECLREISTMSAKTQSLALTKLALEVKGELEKMKEQVQNIE
ncbi:MAG: YicC/YloC family endoribonuclease [Candidatus Alcyoniella australis]|nr:YicC/YloC family endoribonuclease [Candidatus Alcyoniella australis]